MREYSRLPFSWMALVLLVQTGLRAAAPGAAQPLHRDRYGDPLPEHAVARLGTVRLRHSGTVNGLAFSPDGKTLASAGDDHLAVLWEVASGKQLRALPHPGPVRAVLFTPDGATLISADRHVDDSRRETDSRVYLWDVQSGKEVRSLAMPRPNGLAHMVLSLDGKRLFTSTEVGPVVCWDLADGREVWRAKEDQDWCKCLALSPDGKTLAAGSDRGRVRLRDAQTGDVVGSLPTREGDSFQDILSLAYSPDGQTLALTEQGGDLKCWDVAAQKWVRQVQVGASILAPLAFAPDGKSLAYGSQRTLHLYDPAAGKELRWIDGHQCWIRSVAFSADGQYLASAGQDNAIRIWDAATLEPLHPFAGEPGGTCSASFHQGGDRLISSNSCMGYADDGSVFTEGKETCTRRAWDARSVEALRECKPERCVSGPGCLSPDGTVFARSGEDGCVRLLDLDSGKDLRTVGKTGKAFTARPVAFSPDGRVVVVVSNELGAFMTHGWEAKERLRLWDVATGKLAAAVIEGDELNRVNSVQYSPKGRVLVAQEWHMLTRTSIQLWRLDKDQSPQRLGRPNGLAQAALHLLRRAAAMPEPHADEDHPVLSGDGWLLATRADVTEGPEGSKPKERLLVREVLTGQPVLRLEDQGDVCCYAFSPDDRLLALGDEAGCVRLVEVASGKEVQRLPGHRGGIASLEFSADGALLVSGSEDTTALVWDVRACLLKGGAGKAERLSEALWDDLASQDAG
ncbi:MAG TPA: WD40 repeat domain-containing protein, partial [Gemmataceae bacterium]|nr:WD40 repeat domain-containing protein [Gemmataceae bacterium]